MLRKVISTEILKLRRSHIIIVLMILPIISIIIGSANYYFNQSILQKQWFSLWSQVSLFYSEFFLPVLIAICCSYICRLEHLNKNWNKVMTAPISASNVFIAKLIVTGLIILVLQIFFLALYFCAGKLLGLSSPFPSVIFTWFLKGCLSCITITSLQLLLSMRIKSFAAPIGISLCGVFIGLGMYVTKIGMLFPYSLLTIGMSALSGENLSLHDNILFFTNNIIFIILFSLIGIYRLKKVDINT
ncbi:multidrug ABC transporter permease [Vallitalea longa]|uniref:Multidrug ABC transporter permease n=1 Tax=Vallitalea longa TaxID=2936439 RepID=A0A9W6DDC6_9FIRM|nr:ABC transporter permease [Vallitalea longa]GKX28591.1 multidrug ABC transporter permease [Vallitalea longa]